MLVEVAVPCRRPPANVGADRVAVRAGEAERVARPQAGQGDRVLPVEGDDRVGAVGDRRRVGEAEGRVGGAGAVELEARVRPLVGARDLDVAGGVDGGGDGATGGSADGGRESDRGVRAGGEGDRRRGARAVEVVGDRVVARVDRHGRRQRAEAGHGVGSGDRRAGRGLGDLDLVRAGGQGRPSVDAGETDRGRALGEEEGARCNGRGEGGDRAARDGGAGGGDAGDGEGRSSGDGAGRGRGAGERAVRGGGRRRGPRRLRRDAVGGERLGRGREFGREAVERLEGADPGLARRLGVRQLLLGQPLGGHELGDDRRGVEAGDEAVDARHQCLLLLARARWVVCSGAGWSARPGASDQALRISRGA